MREIEASSRNEVDSSPTGKEPKFDNEIMSIIGNINSRALEIKSKIGQKPPVESPVKKFEDQIEEDNDPLN